MTYAEILLATQAAVKQVTLEALHQRLSSGEAIALLDVRERDEQRQGILANAVLIPRGVLEMQVEQFLPDRDVTIVVYCASGIRAAFAAKTLMDLGYTRVESANPGFHHWKELGYPFETPAGLTEPQRERYSRHMQLPEVGEKGQATLLSSRVLLLGAGGLGSAAALYLAAAGVGTLGLVDNDVVDVSNLQRQILHGTDRIGIAKVESATKAIHNLNPDCKVLAIDERLGRDNIDRILGMGWDVIVDGLDNFATRYLLNDASVWQNIPVVHGSVFRFAGQVTTFWPQKGPCYRCLYPAPPPSHLAPSCAEAGVLGILPGVVGTLQATEAIKLLLNQGELLVGRLLTYDSLKMRFQTLTLRRDPSCPVCGLTPTIREHVDYDGYCAGSSDHREATT